MRIRLTLATLFTPILLSFDAAGASDQSSKCLNGRFRVALDVGHTLSQPGAVSAGGTVEFEYNRRLAKAISVELTRSGIATSIIGETGSPLQLTERTRAAQAIGADLFLSVHHDSVQPRYLSSWIVNGRTHRYSDVFQGYSLFISMSNTRAAESIQLAALLGTRLRQAGFKPSMHHAEAIPGESRMLINTELGIYRFNELVVLRTAKMPAVLFEAAVIVNRQEEEQVRNKSFSDRQAAAVAGAILEYCVDRLTNRSKDGTP